jgi:glycosyltransferase involved in cell wall biosynthesis
VSAIFRAKGSPSPVRNKHLVVAVGPMSAASSGIAACTAGLVDQVQNQTAVVRVDTSSKANSGVTRAISRTRTSAVAAAQVIRARRCAKSSLLLTADGGNGKYFSYPVVLIARMLRFTIAIQHHSYAYIRQFSRPASILFRLAGAPNHIVCGQEMAELLAQHYNVDRTKIINLGNIHALCSEVENERSRTDRRLCIAFVGRAEERKGFDSALRVFDALDGIDRSRTRFRMCVIGRVMDDGRTHLERSGTYQRGSLEVLGELRGENLDAALKQVDIVLFPSRYVHEAMPVVVWESMRAGCWVAATDLGATREMLEKSNSMLLPGNPGGDNPWTDGDVSGVISWIMEIERVVLSTERPTRNEAGLRRFSEAKAEWANAMGQIIETLN